MTNPFETASSSAPSVLSVGRYYKWRVDLDYEVDGYSFAMEYRSVTGSSTFTVPGTASGTQVVFEATSSVIGAVNAGEYRWEMIVTRTIDGETSVVDAGYVHVYAATDDKRSHAEIMVTKIESILEGRADSDVDSYTIRSRSITKMSIQDLMNWRDYYRQQIASGENSVGSCSSRKVPSNRVTVRFQ